MCRADALPAVQLPIEVTTMKRTLVSVAAVSAAMLGLGPNITAQQPAPAGGKPDHVAALKQSMAEGTKKLAQYSRWRPPSSA